MCHIECKLLHHCLMLSAEVCTRLKTAELTPDALTYWLSESEKIVLRLFDVNPEVTLYAESISLPKHATKPPSKAWFGGTKTTWEDDVVTLENSCKAFRAVHFSN